MADDGVDVVGDVADDLGGLVGCVLGEDLGEGPDFGVGEEVEAGGAVGVFGAFGGGDLAGDLEQLLEERHGRFGPVELGLAESFEAFGELDVDLVAAGAFDGPADAGFDGVDRFGDGEGAVAARGVGAGERELADRFDGFGVDDDFVEAGAGDGHVGDVAVDEGEGLGAEAVPQQLVGHPGRLDRFVDLGEPPVVVAVSVEGRVGVEELEEGLDADEVAGEPVAVFCGGEAVLGGHEGVEVAGGAVDAVEAVQGVGDGGLELFGEAVGVDGAAARVVGVGGAERGGDLVAEADVVDDEPVELLLAGRGVRPPAVGATDRLEQGVEPQRLVEVHDAFDGGVEPGEELRGDDEEAEGVVVVGEPGLHPRFGLAGQLVAVPPFGRFAFGGADGHHDRRAHLRAAFGEEPVDLGFVGGAQGPVVGDDLAFEAEGGDLGEVVVDDVGAHRGDPVGVRHEGADGGGLVGQQLPLVVVEPFFVGHRLERLVEGGSVDMEVDQAGLDVDRDRRPIGDGPFHAVLVEDPAGVVGVAEQLERVAVPVRDRGAGQPEELGPG